MHITPARRQMLSACVQATTLSLLSEMAFHVLMRSAFNKAEEVEGWRDYNSAMNASSGSGFENDFHLDDRTFYTSSLPYSILALVITSPIACYWHIWLERGFPARYAAVNQDVLEKIPTQNGDNAVARKRVAGGKPHRSSLSWRKTLIKWTLDCTIGRIIIKFIAVLIFWSTSGVDLKDVHLTLLYSYLGGTFMTTYCLASLLAMVVAPAHSRVAFIAGVDFLWAATFGLIVKTFLPWFGSTEFAKDIAFAMNEYASNSTAVIEESSMTGGL